MKIWLLGFLVVSFHMYLTTRVEYLVMNSKVDARADAFASSIHGSFGNVTNGGDRNGEGMARLSTYPLPFSVLKSAAHDQRYVPVRKTRHI